jgi:trehalose 6-phosphate phosphatase
VLTDFDGTLAPIVADPATAIALPGAIEAIGALAARYGRVAVISGRGLAFLATQFGGPGAVPDGLTLIGLYGLERLVDGRIVPHPSAAPWAAVIEAAGAAAAHEAPPGVLVERKGLAIGLHVRGAPEQAGWVESFATERAAATGLLAEPGKLAWELRPPIEVDKGTVVSELAEGLEAVCFAGDDTGDLPAFATLARLRAQGLTTLSVAARSPESPPGLTDAADVVVEGPPGVLAFFRYLLQ